MHKLRTFFLLYLVFFSLFLSLPKATAAQYWADGNFVDKLPWESTSDMKILEPVDSVYQRYTDFAQGYSLLVPLGMQGDFSLSAVRTVFFNENIKIEIYHDNFSGTSANAHDYLHYSNRFAADQRYHTIEFDGMIAVAGLQTHYLEWHRPPLSRVPNDKNYYTSAEIIKSTNEVYTILIKSTQPFSDAENIIRSFRLETPRGTAGIFRPLRMTRPRTAAPTTALYDQFFHTDRPVIWGIFEPSAPETTHYLDTLENTVQYRFPFLIRYHTLEEQLPTYGLQNAYDQGRVVELTFQTILPGTANALGDDPLITRNAGVVYEILNGKHDAYLHEYAERLRSFGHPVLFRLNNEMNGDWCWYSAFYTSKDTDLYIALWRYIRTIFDQHGVTNVLWIWNPHDLSRPEFRWNHHSLYYPGDDYVDIVGLTGYNTGTYFPGETWREFSSIYDPLYREYMQYYPQPFMLSEFASSSVGGDKAAWIQRMFRDINHYPNIKVAIWWSGIDYDAKGIPGRIYLLNEDETVLEAFRTNLTKNKR